MLYLLAARRWGKPKVGRRVKREKNVRRGRAKKEDILSVSLSS